VQRQFLFCNDDLGIVYFPLEKNADTNERCILVRRRGYAERVRMGYADVSECLDPRPDVALEARVPASQRRLRPSERPMLTRPVRRSRGRARAPRNARR
jgi:hypothetical protein